jgi:hypothetical protein
MVELFSEAMAFGGSGAGEFVEGGAAKLAEVEPAIFWRLLERALDRRGAGEAYTLVTILGVWCVTVVLEPLHVRWRLCRRRSGTILEAMGVKS